MNFLSKNNFFLHNLPVKYYFLCIFVRNLFIEF